MWYVRREPGVEAAHESLARGRSVRGWGSAGWCWRCWAEADLGLGPDEVDDLGPEEIAERLGLEPAPWAAEGSRARCGHREPPLAAYLPGLCALAEYDAEPSRDEAAQDAAELGTDYSSLPVLVLYAGEPVGEDPDEGWRLFKPTRVVWAQEE